MAEIWIPESFRERRYAREHFAEIVSWAVENHAFYQKHIPDPQGEVPLLTREIINDDNELLLNGNPQTGSTSGSTGVPVKVSWSKEKAGRERQNNLKIAEMMGGPRPRVRLVSKRECKNRENALDVCRPIEEQVDFIRARHRANGAEVIVTYPTNAENLCRYIEEHGIDLSFIRRVVCYAETYEPHHRELIQRVLPNARAWSTYSSSELGLIAYTCPHDTGFHHTASDGLGIEVINEEGIPCADGEPGRIVATDYFNRNSTFIRYALGDLAIPGTCPCGKIKGPAFQTILGKVRGSLKGRDGRPIMFANIAPVLRDIPGLRQYQVIQEEVERLRFRYVLKPGSDEGEILEKVRSEMDVFLGFSPKIEFEKELVIDREPSGKFHATICRV